MVKLILPRLSALILVAGHVESLKIITELVLEFESHGVALVRRHVIVRFKIYLDIIKLKLYNQISC